MRTVCIILFVAFLAFVGMVFSITRPVEQADLDWCDECEGPCTWDDDCAERHWGRDW